MSLSPLWGQNSVVVRGEKDGNVLHSKVSTFTPASIGRPIVVRRRDPSIFTATSTASQVTGGSLSLASLVYSPDVSMTFWVPDPTRNEIGLLEAMHRRTAANRTYILVHSRPLAELQFNFSTCTGDNIDISHDIFRLPKASAALLKMDRNLLSGGSGGYIRDGVTGSRGKTEVESAEIYGNNQRGVAVCAEAFKEQLRMGLRSINEEEYYLVRYRDYSAWAVQHYACVAKRDSYLWKKYVEQCFAVHVGKEPGELIPITEAQFLFGVELLQRQLLEYVGMCDSLDINYCALSKDQFRSLGAILGDGMRPVGVEGEELQRRREEEAEAARRSTNPHADAYVPPSMWDWTPGAIKKRIRHQLQLQYSRIGRFVVRVVMFGAVTYIVWSYVQPLLPQGDGTGGGNRRQRRGRGPRGQYDAYEGDGASFVPRSLFRSVLLGPKEVFDYILGPPA